MLCRLCDEVCRAAAPRPRGCGLERRPAAARPARRCCRGRVAVARSIRGCLRCRLRRCRQRRTFGSWGDRRGPLGVDGKLPHPCGSGVHACVDGARDEVEQGAEVRVVKEEVINKGLAQRRLVRVKDAQKEARGRRSAGGGTPRRGGHRLPRAEELRVELPRALLEG